MGKFSDTKYINTVDKLVEATKEKLVNPYYPFGDKKPTKVDYYSQNIEKSTLDEASGLYGAHIGKNSPFRFNKVVDFLLYGIDRITTDYSVGDYGTESEPISGDAIILPNTITPRPGDFFSISYVKEVILFKVNEVTPDTLDTGANIYKISYQLELTDSIDSIESQVEKKFNFIVGNVGTDFKSIIQDCDYDLVNKLGSLVNQLITYFNNIFFDSRLQTFVYNHDGWNFYDPFLIEFFIRNKVLNYGDDYLYVSHALNTRKTFGMDYTKTLFYALENPNDDINCDINATADLISDPNSLFVTRMEYYYEVRYRDTSLYKTRFQIVDPDIIDHIKANKMYSKGDKNEYYNLWVAYFNGNNSFINGDILSLIKKTDYMDNLSCFYGLAISIFIIEKYIDSLLS